MVTTLYLTGYEGRTRSRDDFIAWLKNQFLDPELERRVLAIIDASHVAGRPLGVGAAKRSKIAADNLFLSRHNKVAGWVPGAISFQGGWYKLKKGQSPAMPGDRTYHVRMTPKTTTDPDADGLYCLAIDFIGDLTFLAANQAAYYLNEFSDENNEKWHGQGVEYPSSRKRYVYGNKDYDPLPWVPLPGTGIGTPPAPTPQPTRIFAPTPTQRQRKNRFDGKNDVIQVRALQLQCNFWGWRDAMNRTLVVDGEFLSKTDQAVRAMQLALGLFVDGIYGPASARRFQQHLDAMVSL